MAMLLIKTGNMCCAEESQKCFGSNPSQSPWSGAVISPTACAMRVSFTGLNELTNPVNMGW